MPKMGGFQVCERIKAGGTSNDEKKWAIAQIPVIFTSANNSIANLEKWFELGVIDFITKPFAREPFLKPPTRFSDHRNSFLICMPWWLMIRRWSAGRVVKNSLSVMVIGDENLLF